MIVCLSQCSSVTEIVRTSSLELVMMDEVHLMFYWSSRPVGHTQRMAFVPFHWVSETRVGGCIHLIYTLMVSLELLYPLMKSWKLIYLFANICCPTVVYLDTCFRSLFFRYRHVLWSLSFETPYWEALEPWIIKPLTHICSCFSHHTAVAQHPEVPPCNSKSEFVLLMAGNRIRWLPSSFFIDPCGTLLPCSWAQSTLHMERLMCTQIHTCTWTRKEDLRTIK